MSLILSTTMPPPHPTATILGVTRDPLLALFVLLWNITRYWFRSTCLWSWRSPFLECFTVKFKERNWIEGKQDASACNQSKTSPVPTVFSNSVSQINSENVLDVMWCALSSSYKCCSLKRSPELFFGFFSRRDITANLSSLCPCLSVSSTLEIHLKKPFHLFSWRLRSLGPGKPPIAQMVKKGRFKRVHSVRMA